MSDAEIREMLDQMTDQEKREMLCLLRELRRRIDRHLMKSHSDHASGQPTSSLAASF